MCSYYGHFVVFGKVTKSPKCRHKFLVYVYTVGGGTLFFQKQQSPSIFEVSVLFNKKIYVMSYT